jgi:site-specific recombinase XerD
MTRCIEYPCQFSKSRYPKYLPWSKIQSVLAGIDRNAALGKRDYALLSMLSCHGLRPGEVARLHLTDINWEESSFTLRQRKSGVQACLPLAAPAKRALQDYLATRPSSTLPNVFLNHRAPHGPFTPASLRLVAAKCLRKSLGDSLPYYGGYIFRHSFAKAMLDRGASILSIGTMLGHRRLNSTLVYTQIDTKGLREASDNYSDLL